ncbi:MAG TPA: hypothetical protein ENJ00_06255 [Phycisphaerales bacterium]|nr:hypothetical protein [Phycisphaerales bacterium]
MARASRGFTVVELLIVLTLLVAIGSLVLSTAVQWSADEQIRSVESGLTAAAHEARAKALRERTSMDLVAEPNADGLWDVRLVPVVAEVQSESDVEITEDSGSVVEDQPIPTAGEVVYQLPAAGVFERAEMLESETEPGEGLSIGLVRVMPDGWVKPLEPAWRVRFGEPVLAPSVEPWLAEIRLHEEALEADAEEPKFDGDLPALPEVGP